MLIYCLLFKELATFILELHIIIKVTLIGGTMKKLFKSIIVLSILIIAFAGCQLIDFDASNKYVEHGDNYFDLQKYEEAISQYNKAIRINSNNAMAYNNIAAALTFLGRSEEAISYCEKAIDLSPDMGMAYANMGLALNNLKKYEEALVYFDKAIALDSDNDFAYSNKGDALLYLMRYQESLESFQKARTINPDYTNAYLGEALCHYYLENYNEGISICDKIIEGNSDFIDAYLWKAKSLIQKSLYDAALSTLGIVIDKAPGEADAFYIKSIAFLKKEMFEEALSAVNNVIELDDHYFDAYMTKLSILYKQRNYVECVEFGNYAVTKFPDNEDILWYVADSYSAQYKHEEAIGSYKEVLKVNPNNEGVLTYLGWSYYFIEDYVNSEKTLIKALAINQESSIALELKAALEETKLPEGKRIVEFVKNNYLYIDKIKDFDKKSKTFAEKANVTHNEIEEYISLVMTKDDYFTFVLYGEDYDELENLESQSQIEHRPYGKDSYYIKIKSFNLNAGNEFEKIIKSVNSNYNKNLIIDLRDNTGGYTETSNQILDTLLPTCATSTLVYRDKSEEIYKSDGEQIKFKKVIIFVNENSASSSELLSLGLRLKLDNVTIIGSKTYGKGVGQEVFENKRKKYAIFLVSFYWNIDNKNINGTGIKPDILINSYSDSDYYSEVDKIIK
jgi:tetratricopeptide (TPR) repeat protein